MNSPTNVLLLYPFVYIVVLFNYTVAFYILPLCQQPSPLYSFSVVVIVDCLAMDERMMQEGLQNIVDLLILHYCHLVLLLLLLMLFY